MFPGIIDREQTEVTVGPVRVEKKLQERQETVDEPLVTERVEVERVVRNQPVDGPMPVREEGDTIVVPVVKQVLRIEKEWILTEEIRLKRRFEEHPAGETVPIEEEHVQIHQDAAGSPSPRRGRLGGRVPAFKGKLDRWN